MARTEFSRKTKQEALKRADFRCEATGTRYGFEEGQRCNCDLSLGVQYDHNVPDALGGDNSLENCMALCVKCHKWKTRNDVKQIAKSNAQRDKSLGIIRPKQSIPGRGFPPSEKAERRQTKQPLPPRRLFQEQQQ
jgi:5-methylcytosine-specific restriction endonuclease McrA